MIHSSRPKHREQSVDAQKFELPVLPEQIQPGIVCSGKTHGKIARTLVSSNLSIRYGRS
jgi:hypothetical protein